MGGARLARQQRYLAHGASAADFLEHALMAVAVGRGDP
jgi:hypothetical protein